MCFTGTASAALLECPIHYIWFYVWNRHFKDSYDEYEMTSMKWILSEMTVESIMSDVRLASRNPCFPQESGGGCIYPYFFDMTVLEHRYWIQ